MTTTPALDPFAWVTAPRYLLDESTVETRIAEVLGRRIFIVREVDSLMSPYVATREEAREMAEELRADAANTERVQWLGDAISRVAALDLSQRLSEFAAA